MAKKTVPPPCPNCMKLLMDGKIRRETVQPLPQGPGQAAISKRRRGFKICRLCSKAEDIADRDLGLDDGMAQIAVRNEFQEAIRLPKGMNALRGMRLFPELSSADLDSHYEWLDAAVPDIGDE